MRTSIRELSKSINQLSFWPVHDAFGTHACNVPEMMRVVKEKFIEMYQDKDLRYWLDHMVKESLDVEIDFDEDSLQVNDGEYKNMKVKDWEEDHFTFEGTKISIPIQGLESLCSERGLSPSGNRDDRVNRLKEKDAEEKGMTVDELYPPLMLNHLWDQSKTTLDISEVADAGYLIG